PRSFSPPFSDPNRIQRQDIYSVSPLSPRIASYRTIMPNTPSFRVLLSRLVSSISNILSSLSTLFKKLGIKTPKRITKM
ncbi:MAG: hypothetical protein J7K51_09850, partial [Thermotogae bacterium]|nr:hypothetical protein [Thermotogota bacterium]